ncbi:hypothetical protein ACI8AC_10020 [Geodermatophilus sp. SYSU D00758]
MVDDPVVGSHVVVSSAGTRIVLRPGDALTFGRGSACHLRIGHVPEDLRVPRAAGRLECRSDGVLIHNVSDKRPLEVVTFPGPGFEIPPLRLMGTMPHDLVTVVVRGDRGRRHAINIDAGPLGLRSAGSRAPADRGSATVGYRRIDDLTPRQRDLLCALCLPGTLGWDDITGIPTYRQMERILAERGVHVNAKRIRNALDDLRHRLANEHGVADVHGDSSDAPPGGKQSFLPELAAWARISGNVSDAELEAFDQRGS